MIRTVTVEREYGAGGGGIARKLADQLGWKFWDEALTEEIARLAQVDRAAVEQMDERCDSMFYRLMRVFMRGSFEQSVAVTGLAAFDADRMMAFMRRVIEGAAAQGRCVIVGRGAPHFLRNREDAFHVFIYAPLEEKIRRLRESGKSEAQAAQEIATVDHQRVLFIRKFFGQEWPQRQLYHVMLNSKVGDEAVVRTILHGMDVVNARSVAADVTRSAGERN